MLPSTEFGAWFGRFLPTLPYAPLTVTDAADGKLAHLDGLNLSRAWMLNGIARALPERDRKRPALQKLAEAHGKAGLKSVTGQHYEGGHWLGSFAVYYLSERGL